MQRSMVRSVTLNFTEPVYIDYSGITISRYYNGTTQLVASSVAGTYGGLGRTSYQFLFGGTSLPDGSYQFTINLK